MIRTLENTPYNGGNHLFEAAIYVMGEFHSFRSLQEPFLASEYADRLAANPPRFDKHFGWADKAKFSAKFGADVDPVEHGPYQTRTVTIPLLEDQFQRGMRLMTAPTEHHLVAYSIMHDFHEGITGDVPLPEKTKESDEKEMVIWRQVILDAYRDRETKELIEAAALFGTPADTAEYLTWNTVERIGYFATGMQAMHLYESDPELTQDERQMTALMAGKVMGRHLSTLESQRPNFVFLDTLLTTYSTEIDRARVLIEAAG